MMLNMGPLNPTTTLSCGQEALHLPLNRDTPALPGIHTPWHWCFLGPPKPPGCTSSYRLRVGPVGTELDGHGVEDAQLPCHLMHPPQGPLLIRVCKLHHQAGRGALRWGEDGADGGSTAMPQSVYLPWARLAASAAASALGTLPSLAAASSDQCEV